MQQVQALKHEHGEDFDQRIANELLGRGQTPCSSRLLAALYAYRYAPMHHGALAQALPSLTHDVGMVDFGAGPGTALLAVAGACNDRIRYVGIEIASGMQEVHGVAQTTVGSRQSATLHYWPSAHFWREAEVALSAPTGIMAFSYFFAQQLSPAFVTALGRAVRQLEVSNTWIIYTNPLGPAASWMPNCDVHYWYRQFCRELGHRPVIQPLSYLYKASANLDELVERRGECGCEFWRLN